MKNACRFAMSSLGVVAYLTVAAVGCGGSSSPNSVNTGGSTGKAGGGGAKANGSGGTGIAGSDGGVATGGSKADAGTGGATGMDAAVDTSSAAGSGGNGAGGSTQTCATGQPCTLSGGGSGICANNTCGACAVDGICQSAYGTGHICVSGACVAGTCHDGGDCTNAQICALASHTCGPCTDDNSCQVSHGAGQLCMPNGQCVAGTCRTATECSNGQICSANNCVPCTADTQCVSGQLCLSGGCTTGNCRDNGNCSNGQVCLNNNCAPCMTDVQCGFGKLCVTNACVVGDCRTSSDCAGGLVCTNMTCGPCAADSQCPTGDICVGSVCIVGNCHSTANCTTGKICDLNSHACTGCGSDTQCADPTNYGAGNYCQNASCLAGQCRTASDCTGGKLCNGSLACVACATTPECTTALGPNHLCVAGACVSGNCTSTNACTGSGQLCQNMSCVACTTDASCVNDPAYGPQHLCLGNQCVSGNCRTSADCVTGSGQVCNTTTHLCGGCSGSDATCKGDIFYGATTICLANACVTGDCHDVSADCAAGQLCGVSASHACGTCTSDTQCVQDSRYGSGEICYQGSCSPGNCHSQSSDCSSAFPGQLCGATTTNICGPCGNDGQCKSDSFYGSGTICNAASGVNQGKCVSAVCSVSGACPANAGDFCCGGSCVAGNCCVDADCGSFGTACVGHNCTACSAVTGNRFLVDPVNGNDSIATGSGLSGSTVAPACAFKTITRAMLAMPSTPVAGTKIVIVGSAGTTTGLSAGDVLPLILPTNVTLTTQGGPIKITLATTAQGNPAGFRLRNTGSSISGDPAAPLTLDGAITGGNKVSGIGILVDPTVATNIGNVSNVTVQNTNGDGIRVNTGILNIGSGVVVKGSNQDGLRIQGTIAGGAVTLAGVANISVPAGQTQTSFSGNLSHGIEVSTGGSVNVVGVPGAPVPSANGTVMVTGNSVAGLFIRQTSGTTGLLTSNINGLVSWANLTYGSRIFAGSNVKARNSIFLGNAQYGVLVSTNANTAAGNNLSTIDLGTASDMGHNYLQTPLGALGTNASGGLCVALTNCTGACPGPLTEILRARGNFMVSTGNAAVDCSTSTSLITKGTCGGQRSSGVNVATNITTTIDFATCM